MLGTLFLFLVAVLLLLGVIFFFTPRQQTKNVKETEEKHERFSGNQTNNWEQQKEQSRRESEAEKNKQWFTPRRWITDKEIDWVCQRLPNQEMPGSFTAKFKILLAHQFHLVREAKKWNKEEELFTYLLSELTSGTELFLYQ